MREILINACLQPSDRPHGELEALSDATAPTTPYDPLPRFDASQPGLFDHPQPIFCLARARRPAQGQHALLSEMVLSVLGIWKDR